MKRLPYLVLRGILMFAVLLAFLILVVYLTQARNMQLFLLRNLYWSLDRPWGLGRAIINFLAALTAIIIAIPSSRKLIPVRFVPLLVILFCGLILGLLFYTSERCCENPLLLSFGFPFGWVWGVTDKLSSHSPTILGYLFQNRDQIHWRIYLWGLIVDLLFWLNLSFLISSIPKRRRVPNNMQISG